MLQTGSCRAAVQNDDAKPHLLTWNRFCAVLIRGSKSGLKNTMQQDPISIKLYVYMTEALWTFWVFIKEFSEEGGAPVIIS